MSDPIQDFKNERKERISQQGENKALGAHKQGFMEESMRSQYSYNFSWMGRPIIQYPQDMVAMQELIWETKPDIIVETGIAHGGSLIYYASLLELMGGDAYVLGVDIDIREHNRKEIESHPMAKRIKMIQGSSVAEDIVSEVRKHVEGKKSVMVLLDSNHTHEHVLQELEMYHEFVTVGNYMVVFDTIVEDLPKGFFDDRPWDVGDNPKSAVFEFLKSHSNFEIDREIDNKLLISVTPEGYLKRIS